MRRWLPAALVGIVVSGPVLYVLWGPVGIDSLVLRIDSSRITNPLEYPLPLTLLLGASFLSMWFEVPRFGGLKSNTNWGAVGVVGFVLWTVLAYISGMICAFLTSGVVDGYFYLLLISGLATQGTMFVSALWLYRETKSIAFLVSRFDATVSGLIVRGCLQYLRYTPILVVTAFLNHYMLQWIGMDSVAPGSLYFFATADRFRERVLLLLLVAVIAPVCEEWFFRGVLYRLCREWISVIPSALLSSFLFSTVHREPMWFLPVFVLSCLLAREYEKTGSLWVPGTIHSIQNTLSFFMILFVME